jgi:prepilin-type N-terminal cleavage/methylation domain-containing protein/prepilin-type processing-associated H-X9-DG protein
MRPTSRRAFTIIELLLTIAIIGILIALTLPSIQAAREAGRRLTCRSNLRQIGVALQHYQSVLNSFPPAVIWEPPGELLGQGLLPVGVIDRVARYADVDADTIFANWLLLALPYLEQSAALQSSNLRFPISAHQNAGIRALDIATLKCPSDSWNGPENHYQRGIDAGLTTNEYARGNYAINFGVDANCISGMPAADGKPCSAGFSVTNRDLAKTNNSVWGSGIAGVNKSFAPRDIRDGASTTIAVDEIRAGLHAADPRGAWALGQIGASMVARNGKYADLSGPNPDGSDAIIGCWALKYELGGGFPESQGMPCRKEIGNEELNLKAGSRSLHPGGVHVLMCDGSAHFLTDQITRDIWHALHTRSGGEPAEWSE